MRHIMGPSIGWYTSREEMPHRGDQVKTGVVVALTVTVTVTEFPEQSPKASAESASAESEQAAADVRRTNPAKRSHR
jgi:hypothetical protein